VVVSPNTLQPENYVGDFYFCALKLLNFRIKKPKIGKTKQKGFFGAKR